MFRQIVKVGFIVSIVSFFIPFFLAMIGYGGEAFAQAGWVYSLMASPFIVFFLLLMYVTRIKK